MTVIRNRAALAAFLLLASTGAADEPKTPPKAPATPVADLLRCVCPEPPIDLEAACKARVSRKWEDKVNRQRGRKP